MTLKRKAFSQEQKTKKINWKQVNIEKGYH